MANVTISPDEIRAALDTYVKSYEPKGAVRDEVGRVTLAGDVLAGVEAAHGHGQGVDRRTVVVGQPAVELKIFDESPNHAPWNHAL